MSATKVFTYSTFKKLGLYLALSHPQTSLKLNRSFFPHMKSTMPVLRNGFFMTLSSVKSTFNVRTPDMNDLVTIHIQILSKEYTLKSTPYRNTVIIH